MASNPDTSFHPDPHARNAAAAQSAQHGVVSQDGEHIHTGTISGIGIAVGTGAHVAVTISAEQAYTVAGLPNPYLGLRAFTERERAIFAGRERIVQALVERLSPDTGDRLLFLVGASGSGKSSLARAGLLPALADRFRDDGYAVQTRIIDHPGYRPATVLARLLLELPTAAHGPSRPVFLILIDQFEEIFSQTAADEAQHVLGMLSDLAAQPDVPIRMIATLRSDFLPQLVADARFEGYERRKVVVRAMSEHELQDAIQRPLQLHHPNKRFEPALLERLAHDAAADAAYLPLLQVTLEELWRGGDLRLGAYQGLADAIQRRAETIVTYRDYDGLQQEARPPDERAAILGLLLDLVRVALDDELPAQRWRRPRAELTQGNPQREQFIADLTAARLLRTDRELWSTDGGEQAVETVDIVHEALLRGWPTLRHAIDQERETLRQRVRFDQVLREWQTHNQHDPYLLDGVRLSEAQELDARGDVALRSPAAQALLRRSLRRKEARRRRLLSLSGSIIVVLLATLGFAGYQWQTTQAQLNVSDSQRLAVVAQNLSNWADDSEQALLLAQEAALRDPNQTAEQALRDRLQRMWWRPPVLRGHTAPVSSAVFSPDGQLIVTASMDGTARLWSQDGTPLAVFTAHTDDIHHSAFTPTDDITSVVFSPDGQTILTASDAGIARLWDRQGKELAIFTGHTYGISSAIFSPDGATILTASGDWTVRLWNRQGQLLGVLNHEAGVNTIVFSPDGQFILTASFDNTARLWDRQGKELAVLQGHTEGLNSAVFSPDGQSIVTASADGTARLWDRQGKTLTTFTRHHDDADNELYDYVTSAVFSPDGQSILTAAADNTARLWDRQGKELAVLQGHTNTVISAIFSPDGQTILTASDDGTARLFHRDGQQIALFQGHSSAVTSAVFSPDGRTMLTASADGTARLWEQQSSEYAVLHGHTSPIIDATFSPDGQYILTAPLNGTPRLWDRQGRMITMFEETIIRIESATFSPDGQTILTASWDGKARLWDIQGRNLVTVSSQTFAASEAIFSPDGQYILTVADDTRLWDRQGREVLRIASRDFNVAFSPDGQRLLTGAILRDRQGRELAVLEGQSGELTSVVFRPDGQLILTAANDGTVRLWDRLGQALAVLDGHTERVNSAVFSPDGQTILTASDDKTARLWNLQGQTIARFQGHTAPVTSAVFRPDGQTILTASTDKTARLWTPQGQELVVLPGHTAPVSSAVFSPDGQLILTASDDSTARLYLVPIADVLAVAACRVSRDLTDDEMQRFTIRERRFVFSKRQCPPVFGWQPDRP